MVVVSKFDGANGGFSFFDRKARQRLFDAADRDVVIAAIEVLF